MCGTCGCSENTEQSSAPRVVPLEQRVLAKNDELAESNRAWLRERGVVAINLMSSPGAGKTTLLERTLRDFTGAAVGVVEGDQETDFDAARLRAAGCSAVQLNTGTGCHLDAAMVRRGLEELQPPAGSVVFVENVGNLVCPALFDLGEQAGVVIASVPEGEDKPLKYPHMFRAADVVLLNKTDLLPHLAFDVRLFEENARRINPQVRVLPVSALRGSGLDQWYCWLEAQLPVAAG